MGEAEAVWRRLSGLDVAPVPGPVSRRDRDQLVCGNSFVHGAVGSDRAVLLAAKSQLSGSWLGALPSPNLGLRLGNPELRIAVGLHLGYLVVR